MIYIYSGRFCGRRCFISSSFELTVHCCNLLLYYIVYLSAARSSANAIRLEGRQPRPKKRRDQQQRFCACNNCKQNSSACGGRYIVLLYATYFTICNFSFSMYNRIVYIFLLLFLYKTFGSPQFDPTTSEQRPTMSNSERRDWQKRRERERESV